MKSEIDKIQAYVPKIRRAIPPQYNQIRLLDYISDDDVQLMVSITTRGDGKTYNYMLALIKIALKFKDFKFVLLSRHFTLRGSYQQTINTILQEQFKLTRGDIFFDNNNQYSILYVKDEPICILTELKSATDLKYSSTTLRNYRFILYDEFIAIRGDYNPEEAEQLKTIYESIARPSDSAIPEIPKIMLLGNPHNFDSPLFSYFNLYRILDKQAVNTIEKHGDTVIERWKNEKSLGSVKSELFGKTDDNAMYNGEFVTNSALIADPKLISHAKNYISIKLENEQYLLIHYINAKKYYLEITYKRPNKIIYTTVLLGLNDGVKYLDDSYYSQILASEHDDGLIKYANTFTITQFDRNPQLKEIDYQQLIYDNIDKPKTETTYKDDERQLYIEQENRLKRKLFEEYLN